MNTHQVLFLTFITIVIAGVAVGTDAFALGVASGAACWLLAPAR